MFEKDNCTQNILLFSLFHKLEMVGENRDRERERDRSES